MRWKSPAIHVAFIRDFSALMSGVLMVMVPSHFTGSRFATDSGLGGEDVDADDAVLPSGAFLRRPREAVKVLAHLHRAEPGRSQDLGKLCRRQSAGDSTRPEIDVAPDRLGQLAGNDDVGVEEGAAGFQHA